MTQNETPSETTIDGAPARALKFLSAVSRRPAVFAALATRGYDDEEHQRGWELLWEVSGYRKPKADGGPTTDATVQSAIAEIDAWDEPNFRVIRATLRAFPDQSEHVFGDGLAATTGTDAVLGVRKMLDRLDQLESDPERKKTRKTDAAALAKVAKRGVTPAVRAHLRELIATASATPELAEVVAPSPETLAKREASKVALYDFWHEWSDIAHAVIARRDHLIALGIAQMKKRAAADEDEKEEGGGDGNGEGTPPASALEATKRVVPPAEKPAAKPTARKRKR